jgi:murein DD-endopeptidase MepM/ murein hydrolase activator NlpD
VSVGQRLARGQTVGYSGSTGWSTACHLHFIVMVNGATVDPINWL